MDICPTRWFFNPQSFLSTVVGVLAVIIDPQAICTRWLLFRALASSLLAIETAILRALLMSHNLILACPQPSITLVATRFCLVALDLFLATTDTGFVPC